MERRDLIKAAGTLAAAASVTGVAPATAQVAGGAAGGNALVEISPPDPAAFIAGRFAGKTILVTGSARGIGKGVALRLAREGANVIGVDWIKDMGEATDAEIRAAGGKSIFVHGDIGEAATADAAVAAAIASFGRLDGAVNNAGVMDGVFSGDPVDYETQKPLVFAPIHEATEEYWSKVFHTNALGTFLMMRAQLKQLVAQLKGGAIVNVGSIAGLTGLSGNPAYVASKHAVNGLTRNAAIDYAPYGIRVNSVNMAATDTPMVARAGALVAASRKASTGPTMGGIKTQSILAWTDPEHRPSTVAEQVSMILFLLSPEASNFTGGVFPTDGGWTNY
jgi:NAD(P)-dependent dehydrogenase (short-subunit alcohol dehydrogenase family)